MTWFCHQRWISWEEELKLVGGAPSDTPGQHRGFSQTRHAVGLPVWGVFTPQWKTHAARHSFLFTCFTVHQVVSTKLLGLEKAGEIVLLWKQNILEKISQLQIWRQLLHSVQHGIFQTTVCCGAHVIRLLYVGWNGHLYKVYITIVTNYRFAHFLYDRLSSCSFQKRSRSNLRTHTANVYITV